MSEPMTTTGELAEIEALVGPVAAQEFDNAPDDATPELLHWVRGLSGLTDGQLLDEAARWIYESASVQRFRGNFEHLHCKVASVYREAHRRHVAAGHDKDCRGDTIYSQAYQRVVRDAGYPALAQIYVCTCRTGS